MEICRMPKNEAIKADMVEEKQKPKIICISGKAEHGKDTTGRMIKTVLEMMGKRAIICHYGDLVKHCAKSFYEWDGNKDERGRTILQMIGTEIVREKDPYFWVDFMMSAVDFFCDEYDAVILPDCRYPNEVFCWRNAGYKSVWLNVYRHGYESSLDQEQKNHESENALDDYAPDFGATNLKPDELLASAVKAVRKVFHIDE